MNGRAALCAGKDDLSSEDEEIASEPTDEAKIKHKFSHPDNFKMVLESGKIPDAAMIHAARKSRQKAREQGMPPPPSSIYICLTIINPFFHQVTSFQSKNNNKKKLKKEIV